MSFGMTSVINIKKNVYDAVHAVVKPTKKSRWEHVKHIDKVCGIQGLYGLCNRLAMNLDRRTLSIIARKLRRGNYDERMIAVGVLDYVKVRPVNYKVLFALIAALKDKKVCVREFAAVALARFKHRRAVPALIRALRDPHPYVRENAAEALGNTKDRRAVPALIKTMKGYKPSSRSPYKTKGCQDLDRYPRAQAAVALGQIGDKRAVRYLEAAARDKAVIVRDHAIGALLKIDKKRAVATLKKMCNHPNPDVRETAEHHLGELSGGDRDTRTHGEVVADRIKAYEAYLEDARKKREKVRIIATRIWDVADPVASRKLIAVLMSIGTVEAGFTLLRIALQSSLFPWRSHYSFLHGMALQGYADVMRNIVVSSD